MLKKLLSVGVVLALVAAVLVGVGASTASAQTSLCQTVDALIAAGVIAPDKVVAAKAAAGCTATPAGAYTFTRSLTLGSTGDDVTALQNFLISNGNSIPAGATGYFGAQTQAAVAAYQAAKGITPAVGYFGPLTMASVNANTVVVVPTTTTTTTTTTPAASGALEGGAGSATFATTTTNVESVVNEGADNTKVLGFKVEAEDSDVAVTNVKVTLVTSGSGASTRIDRYLDTVSVMMGSDVVGSADISDFTKTGTTYTKSIALSDAIVRDGSANKETFYVVVDAVSSIDSVNRAAASTVLTVSEFRYMDGSGVTITPSDSIVETFTYSTLADSGDVKVAVSKGSSNPLVGNVEVSDTGATNDVLMLEFKVKATGSDVSFDTLYVNLVTTTSDATDIVSRLVLMKGSAELASIDGADLAATSTFDLDETYTVEAGNTDTFRVYADINDQDNFADASTLSVSFTGSTGFSPEDENGDTVTATGSATGEVQTFLLNGASVTFVSSTYNVANVTDEIDGLITMKFTVDAFGDNDITIAEDQFADGAKGTGVASQTAGAGLLVYTLTGGTTNGAIVSSTNITKDGSDNFVVSAGSSGTFTLSVKILFSSTSGFVKLTLNNVDETAVSNVATSNY